MKGQLAKKHFLQFSLTSVCSRFRSSAALFVEVFNDNMDESFASLMRFKNIFNAEVKFFGKLLKRSISPLRENYNLRKYYERQW